MLSARSLLAPAAAITLLPAPALASSASTGSGKVSALEHALLSSRELWATVDVCNPTDHPNTVGVRGSMPGDGQTHDRMYMSFRLQYLDTTTNHWVDLASAAPDFVAVGSGASARQGGRTFELMPVKSAVVLRGVVDFEWRRGKTVVESAARPTSSGHRSLAGADPADYTAATCSIG